LPTCRLGPSRPVDRSPSCHPPGARVWPFDAIDAATKPTKSGAPELPEGEPVEVTYFVDKDMVLNVTGVLQKTGEKIEIRCDGVGVKIPDAPMPGGINID